MITSENIKQIVEEYILGSDKYVVEVAVRPVNRITVEIDSHAGININDCTLLHKYIESKFDRDKEDFELMVSSPGLEEPFKIIKQYEKNLGRIVRVIHKTGIVSEGELTKTDDSGIVITKESKEKINGKKQLVNKQIPVAFEQIKETKLLLQV